MNKNQIKKLAEITFDGKQINPNVARFALEKLSQSELKIYYSLLKIMLERNEIVVKTSQDVDQEEKKQFERMFEGCDIMFQTDPSLGAGVYIKSGDDIRDMTLKNYVDQTVNSIKSEL